MATTTDTRLTPLEARLYAAAVLAIGYLVAWHGIAPAQPTVAEPAAAAPVDAPIAAAPPPGWHVVGREPPAIRRAPAVVHRVPASRPRTRSS